MTKTPASPSPGPWADPERPERDVFEPHNGHTTTPEDYLAIHIGEGNELEGENYITVHGPNQEANARLVASAPEMLSMLKWLEEITDVPEAHCSCHIAPPCSDCVEYGAIREAMKNTRALIAKAEGKS